LVGQKLAISGGDERIYLLLRLDVRMGEKQPLRPDGVKNKSTIKEGCQAG
jgi:hypothetical protein